MAPKTVLLDAPIQKPQQLNRPNPHHTIMSRDAVAWNYKVVCVLTD